MFGKTLVVWTLTELAGNDLGVGYGMFSLLPGKLNLWREGWKILWFWGSPLVTFLLYFLFLVAGTVSYC